MATEIFEATTRRQRLVTGPAGTPVSRTLLDVFAEAVSGAPQRVAVDAPDSVLSYLELADAVSDLSVQLRARGIGPGDRVGVRVPSGTAQLYVAILGVLSAGAAYVPVDADDPAARALKAWQGSGACAVIEDGLNITELAAAQAADRDVTADDDAWVIFTSGSTGEPKAVAVTHRAAAALIHAEARLWSVSRDDRVLAGLSVGFDASCEEMWLAWRNGAALVPAPRAVVRSGADLGRWLATQGVTVVSTVPTLAAMWEDDDLADVRLLILGGEACPDQLGWRLASSREVWNTYGPTEATVVSTAARVFPGEPVTIGRPLDGWQIAVVDALGEPVPFGEPGELVIGGIGLGRYLDPALDAQRFAPVAALGSARSYRTGDIARETITGLDFVGRRDEQVKLGGRRVELGEIDAHLSAAPGVRAAATAVQESASGNSMLVGYVTGEAEAAQVRAALAERLPEGVVPLVVVLDSLPTTSSGKVDRAALPWPPPPSGVSEPTLAGTAGWLAEQWADQLGSRPTAADSDFFEMGGTSLAAAKLVSVLRRRYPTVAVADIYNHRRLGQLADALDRLDRSGEAAVAAPVPAARSRWGAVQLAGVFVLLALSTPAWLVGILAYNHSLGGQVGPQVGWGWLIAGWLMLCSAPGRAMIVLLARRILLSRLRPGRYPRHGWLACRLWFMERLAQLGHIDRLAGTPWAPRYARICGADVGENVRLGTLPPPTSLIRIGDGATLETDVDVHGFWIDGSEVVVGELRIGAGARIGSRSLLMPGAEIGAGAEIEPGSVVTGIVPARERWSGSPARCAGVAGEDWPVDGPPPLGRRRLWRVMYALGMLVLALLPLAAALPGLGLLAALGAYAGTPESAVMMLLASAPLIAAAFLLSYALLAALLFRSASRLLRPGWHVDEGATPWALWFTEAVMTGARAVLFPVYASVYTRGWLRLLGLKVGKRTEMCTAMGLNRLVTFADTSFVADDVLFAVARARDGWLHVAPIKVGSRTFLGNCAILAPGTTLGNDCLVGVLSQAPAATADATSWLGSPPLELPRVPDRPDPSRTTNPSLGLVLGRGAMELVRILLPGSLGVALGGLVFLVLDTIGATTGSPVVMAAAAPFVLAAAGVCAVALTIAAKWLIIGRYRAGEHPLWSFFVWRDELINSCQEQLAGVWLLTPATATPVMSAYLRAMGARVGKDVWCETLAITEYDIVDIGDGAVVNRRGCIETHLFHDRLMRIGPSKLGVGSTLGPSSAVLPDTTLGDGCSVGGRSIVLRGEDLPAGTRWHGAPVVGA